MTTTWGLRDKPAGDNQLSNHGWLADMGSWDFREKNYLFQETLARLTNNWLHKTGRGAGLCYCQPSWQLAALSHSTVWYLWDLSLVRHTNLPILIFIFLEKQGKHMYNPNDLYFPNEPAAETTKFPNTWPTYDNLVITFTEFFKVWTSKINSLTMNATPANRWCGLAAIVSLSHRHHRRRRFNGIKRFWLTNRQIRSAVWQRVRLPQTQHTTLTHSTANIHGCLMPSADYDNL